MIEIKKIARLVYDLEGFLEPKKERPKWISVRKKYIDDVEKVISLSENDITVPTNLQKETFMYFILRMIQKLHKNDN